MGGSKVRDVRSHSVWNQAVHQLLLGTAEWIEKTREFVESKPRSDEYAQLRRAVGRPTNQAIVKVVTAVFDPDRTDAQGRLAGGQGGCVLRQRIESLGMICVKQIRRPTNRRNKRCEAYEDQPPCWRPARSQTIMPADC